MSPTSDPPPEGRGNWGDWSLGCLGEKGTVWIKGEFSLPSGC